MTPVERDDIIHALTQLQAFYGKDLDELSVKLWMRALGPHEPSDIKRALADYPSRGRYAPKPREIIELIEEQRQERRRHTQTLPKPEPCKCPPEIAAAWMWFISMVASQGANEQLAGAVERKDAPAALQERYLHIVNHEAFRLGTPDAIPDAYKLPEVWGAVA